MSAAAEPQALWIVTTTVATQEQALALARCMVERHLAACAQIERIESVYRWRGAVTAGPEHRLTLKTTAARHAALAAELRRQHPYELPQIVAVEAVAVDPGYLDWVRDNVRAPSD